MFNYRRENKKSARKTILNVITIILPTYNEAQNIRRIVKEIRQAIDCEIIVVDDNSPDKTWKKAQRLGVRVIRRFEKKGLAKSVVDGIKNATHDTIIIMDADLQHPTKTLPNLAKELEENEFVTASRTLPTQGLTRKRELLSKTVNWSVKKVLGIKISDPMTGYFGIRKNVYERCKQEIKPKGYKIMLELLVKSRAKPKEIFFEFKPRKTGKSKTSLKTGIELLLQIIDNATFKIKHHKNLE